ncbi:MAG TPA: fluoride efflux transporter CrcB [Bacilli bacterium]|nr:fluoride efflux transporter CrcB [Bacilli bacterium]
MSYLAVMIGGGIGALLRYGLGVGVPYDHWTTLATNLLGCLVLGFFLTYAAGSGRVPEGLRVGIGTGMLGGFTTFSTFCVESVRLLQEGYVGQALIYMLGNLIGGVILAWVGYSLAQKVVQAR